MRRFRNICIIAALVIGCFVLETAVFPAISSGGAVPDLLVALTCSLALLFGDRYGICIGFLSGLLSDIFFGRYLGLNALSCSIVGYLAGKFERLIYPDDVKIPVLVIAAGDFISGFLTFVFRFLFRGRLVLGYFLVHSVLPEMLYTALVSLLLYPFILWLYRKFLRPIRESEKNYAEHDSAVS